MGLNHMHSKKILHRDIKSLNVFLDENLNVKLGDMGVAKVCASQVVAACSQLQLWHQVQQGCASNIWKEMRPMLLHHSFASARTVVNSGIASCVGTLCPDLHVILWHAICC
jgi:serine/threonine protein kinase